MTYATIKIENETYRIRVYPHDKAETIIAYARCKYATKRFGPVQTMSIKWERERSDELNFWFCGEVTTENGNVENMEWFERKLDRLHNTLNAEKAIARAKQKEAK